MTQQMKEQTDAQTSKPALVRETIRNYQVVCKSYKQVLRMAVLHKKKYTISEIYTLILSDLGWNNSRRPTVRQQVGRYKKEIELESKVEIKK